MVRRSDPFTMLAPALVVTLAAVAVIGAPSPARSVGNVPIVDSYIPFSGKVPRTFSRYPGVSMRDDRHLSREGQGTQVAFDAPDGGSQYTLNLTIAGESYNLIFDTGRWIEFHEDELIHSSDLWLPASNFSCLSAYDPEVLASYTNEPQVFCEFGPHLFDASTLGQLTPVNFTNNCMFVLRTVTDRSQHLLRCARLQRSSICDRIVVHWSGHHWKRHCS